jgi:hypothetical protein
VRIIDKTLEGCIKNISLLCAVEVAASIQGLFRSGAGSAPVKTGVTIPPEAGGGNIVDFGNEDGCWHNDMFLDAHENYLGTDKEVCCSTGEAGWPDVDPFDSFPDGKANVFDIMKFYEAPQAYGSDLSKDHIGYKRRLDLFGPDGKVNVFDIMQYFVAPQAYGNDCPYTGG